jgi:hypothetical protein
MDLFSSFFRSKPVMILMDREFSQEQLSEKGALDLRNINDSAWKVIRSRCVAVEISSAIAALGIAHAAAGDVVAHAPQTTAKPLGELVPRAPQPRL